MFCLPALALALSATVYAPPPGVNFALHVGASGTLRMPREEVARKAVGAMAKQAFRYAGVDPDGHAWGYSGTVTAAVLLFNFPDGQVLPMVCAAGWDNADAE